MVITQPYVNNNMALNFDITIDQLTIVGTYFINAHIGLCQLSELPLSKVLQNFWKAKWLCHVSLLIATDP